MLETSERVALYKKELAEDKKLPVFDLWAFVFNSFYYIYHDSLSWFLLFFCLPLIAMFMPGDPDFNFLCGLCATRVVNGFAAPRIIRGRKKKYVEAFAEADPDARIEYFSVSPLRLFVLSVLSNGLYLFYWSYKNWAAVRKCTKDDVWPILRGWILWLFFVIPLFLRMKHSLEQSGRSAKKLMVCGAAFFVLYAGYHLGDKFLEQIAQALPLELMVIVYSFVAVFLAAAVMLALLQKEINLYNGIKVRKNVLPGEVIVTLLGIYSVLLAAGVVPPII